MFERTDNFLRLSFILTEAYPSNDVNLSFNIWTNWKKLLSREIVRVLILGITSDYKKIIRYVNKLIISQWRGSEKIHLNFEMINS